MLKSTVKVKSITSKCFKYSCKTILLWHHR